MVMLMRHPFQQLFNRFRSLRQPTGFQVPQNLLNPARLGVLHLYRIMVQVVSLSTDSVPLVGSANAPTLSRLANYPPRG